MTDTTAAQPLDLDRLEALLRKPEGVVSRGIMHDAMRQAADFIAKARAAQPESATGTTGESIGPDEMADMIPQGAVVQQDGDVRRVCMTYAELKQFAQLAAKGQGEATQVGHMRLLENGTKMGISFDKVDEPLVEGWRQVPVFAYLAAPASAQPDRGAAQGNECERCEDGYVYNTYHNRRMPCRDCAPSPASQPVAPEAAQADVIEILLDVVRLAYDAMDNTEDDGNGLHWHKPDFDALSDVMDKLEALPDDQPGYVMGPAAKARWAMHGAAIAPSDAKGKADAAKCRGCDPAEGFCKDCRDAERQKADAANAGGLLPDVEFKRLADTILQATTNGARLEALRGMAELFDRTAATGASDAKDAIVPDHSEREAANAGGRTVTNPNGSTSTYISEYENDLENDLAACRDLFPTPDHGELHDLWSEACSDPRAVVAYVKAQFSATIAAGQGATNAKDAKDAAQWRDLLLCVMREMPQPFHHDDGNAPGHGHSKPGIWDQYNGAKSGTECAWCKVWNTARKELERAAMAAAPFSEKGSDK